MANQVKQISKGTQAKFITVDTLEYMVSLIVGGAFLAHLTKTIGIPDSISGIISAFSPANKESPEQSKLHRQSPDKYFRIS